jgi:hypothetical protein
VPISDKLGRNPATFGRHHQIPGIPCQIQARLAGIWPERPDLWLSCRIRPERRIIGHLAWILDRSDRSARISGRLARTARPPAFGRIRPVRQGSSQNGGIPARWPETGQDGRLPAALYQILAKMARFRQLLPEFVFAKYKIIFLYYFLFCE